MNKKVRKPTKATAIENIKSFFHSNVITFTNMDIKVQIVD